MPASTRACRFAPKSPSGGLNQGTIRLVLPTGEPMPGCDTVVLPGRKLRWPVGVST